MQEKQNTSSAPASIQNTKDCCRRSRLISALRRPFRYLRYLTQWIFLEKIRGLDFTMTDLSLVAATDGLYHGYSKTDEKHARAILDSLAPDASRHLLDIGCGKGAFLRIASQYPFGSIGGIELLEHLLETARRNFRILRLSDRIHLDHADALEYESYHLYNTFYFFNPFQTEIMMQVLQKILLSQKETFQIILHNPSAGLSPEQLGGIRICSLHDPAKDYVTVIYQFPPKENTDETGIAFEGSFHIDSKKRECRKITKS